MSIRLLFVSVQLKVAAGSMGQPYSSRKPVGIWFLSIGWKIYCSNFCVVLVSICAVDGMQYISIAKHKYALDIFFICNFLKVN